jgi:tripartite-type tricarboxylate transporter receptor subunit TctC
MKATMRTSLVIATVTAIALLGGGAQAQETFPHRPLKIVVPTSPGSGSDTTARFFGEQLAAVLGQPVVIDNKAGANGVIAAMAVKQAPADGYTLFLATNTHMAVNPVVVKDLPYDSVKDFKFVGGLARGMMVFVAPPGSPLRNAADLAAGAKTAPDKHNVGSYTAGFHLAAARFQNLSGTRHVYVPYKGAPEVFNALMGNQLDWAVTDLIAALPQVKSGKLKALAVSGDKRHPDSPDVPTLKESGYPEYVNYTWTSLVVRADTPEATTARLVEALNRVMATPAAKDFTARIGSEPLLLGPAEMRKFQASETERFRRIADGAGIKPQ